MSILRSIYGFENVKTVNDTYWVLEQVIDGNMQYTAKVFKAGDGTAYIEVWTTDKVPKLVTGYEYPETGKEANYENGCIRENR